MNENAAAAAAAGAPSMEQVSVARRYRFAPVTITVPANDYRHQFDLTITEATVITGAERVEIVVTGTPVGSTPNLRNQHVIRYSTLGGIPGVIGGGIPISEAPDFLLATLGSD